MGTASHGGRGSLGFPFFALERKLYIIGGHLMKLIKIIGKTLLFVLSLLLAVVLTLAFLLLLTFLQEKILMPEQHLYWIMKSPYSYLFLFFEVELIAFMGYFLSKDIKSAVRYVQKKLERALPHWKRWRNGSLIFVNLLLVYLLFIHVSVLTDEGIIDHSAFNPQGTFHAYESLSAIDTGIHGEKKKSFTFQGEFYYKVTLENGRVLNLADMGGSSTEEDFRFVLSRLDKRLLDLGISKTASTENLSYLYETLDPIYVEAIEEMLTRTK